MNYFQIFTVNFKISLPSIRQLQKRVLHFLIERQTFAFDVLVYHFQCFFRFMFHFQQIHVKDVLPICIHCIGITAEVRKIFMRHVETHFGCTEKITASVDNFYDF